MSNIKPSRLLLKKDALCLYCQLIVNDLATVVAAAVVVLMVTKIDL